MARKPRFVLYQKEHSTHRYRIAPANALGFFVFLANLGGLLFGCFEMLGMYGLIPAWLGTLIFIVALGVFLYSMMFLTDYSRPGDGA